MEVKETILKLGGDVKNSAEKIAKGAIDGSKKMAEKVKIKRSISEAESVLNAAYIEIGKKYEELYGNRGEAEFAQILAQVAKARHRLLWQERILLLWTVQVSAAAAAIMCRRVRLIALTAARSRKQSRSRLRSLTKISIPEAYRQAASDIQKRLFCEEVDSDV